MKPADVLSIRGESLLDSEASVRRPRVLFVAPLGFGLSVGGMQRQVAATAQQLENLQLATVIHTDPWQYSFDGIDVCHLFTTSPEILPYAVAARSLSIPVVVSPIYYPSDVLPIAAVKARALAGLPGLYGNLAAARALLQIASRVLVLSTSEARALRIVFGVSRARMFEVPNGVDPRFAQSTPDAFRAAYGHRPDVLFVGRLDRNKNVLRLIRAIERTDLNLSIIGFASQADPDVEREVMRSVGKRVRYLGPVPWDSALLPSAYASARVVCLPSFKEVMPLTLLEALAAGCRIVTTRNSAMTELLLDEAQYCDPRSVESIRSAILTALRSRAPERARARVISHFTWPEIARRVAGHYIAAMANRPNCAPRSAFEVSPPVLCDQAPDGAREDRA